MRVDKLSKSFRHIDRGEISLGGCAWQRVQINDVSATPRQKDDDVHAETDEVLEP
jgi:hypothetical protein